MPNVVVGGQAVLEGVMMRAPGIMTIAVRRQSGSILVHTDALKSVTDRLIWLRKPFLRGVLALFQSLILGFKALNFSSAIAMEDIDLEQNPGMKPSDDSGIARKNSMSTWNIILVIVLTVLVAIGFFFILPLVLTEWISKFNPLAQHSLVFNLIDGLIRILFLMLYIYGISLMPDIRRVFQYHGAEHKAIHTYEAGLPLTVENAKPFTTLHPRCGTAFLLTVMVVAMLIFSMIPSSAPLFLKAALRIVLLPVIAGVSFELIKKASEHNHPLINWVMTPGLWLQKITTQEPDDQQLEVGLTALRVALDQSRPAATDIII